MFRLNRVFTAAVATVAAVALTACSSSTDATESTTSSAASAPSSADPSGDDSSAAETSADESATDESTGAATEESPAGSSAEESAGAPTSSTVSTMFGDVTVEFPADGDLKVVALGWSDAENALALGVQPIAVYDWQSFGDANKGVGPWATAEFGDVTPTVFPASGDALNFEAIQALEPDLILNTRSDNSEETYERLAQIAPTVYAPDAETPSFGTPWDVQLQQVADALGLSEDGAELIESLQTDIGAVATDNPEFAGKSIVAASKFGEAYGAYLAGDGRFDVLASFGFVQNQAVSDIPVDSSFYVPISAEQIPALDADVAVILPIGFTADEILADPLLSALTVVKDGRAIVLEGTSELGGAYSAASALSIPIVLEQLVPQLKEAAAKVG